MTADYPDWQHIQAVCKIGKGKECCRYLAIGHSTTLGAAGWSCEKHSNMRAILDARVAAGKHRARGDNCPGKSAR
jgi:hypothetical protein